MPHYQCDNQTEQSVIFIIKKEGHRMSNELQKFLADLNSIVQGKLLTATTVHQDAVNLYQQLETLNLQDAFKADITNFGANQDSLIGDLINYLGLDNRDQYKLLQCQFTATAILAEQSGNVEFIITPINAALSAIVNGKSISTQNLIVLFQALISILSKSTLDTHTLSDAFKTDVMCFQYYPNIADNCVRLISKMIASDPNGQDYAAAILAEQSGNVSSITNSINADLNTIKNSQSAVPSNIEIRLTINFKALGLILLYSTLDTSLLNTNFKKDLLCFQSYPNTANCKGLIGDMFTSKFDKNNLSALQYEYTGTEKSLISAINASLNSVSNGGCVDGLTLSNQFITLACLYYLRVCSSEPNIAKDLADFLQNGIKGTGTIAQMFARAVGTQVCNANSAGLYAAELFPLSLC